MGKHNSFENSMIRLFLSPLFSSVPQNHQVSCPITTDANPSEIWNGKTMGKHLLRYTMPFIITFLLVGYNYFIWDNNKDRSSNESHKWLHRIVCSLLLAGEINHPSINVCILYHNSYTHIFRYHLSWVYHICSKSILVFPNVLFCFEQNLSAMEK